MFTFTYTKWRGWSSEQITVEYLYLEQAELNHWILSQRSSAFPSEIQLI